MNSPAFRTAFATFLIGTMACSGSEPVHRCQGLAQRVAEDGTTEVLAVYTGHSDDTFLIAAHAWAIPAVIERLPWRSDDGDTDVRAARVDLEQLQRGGIPLARDWVLGPCEQGQENIRCALEPEGTLLLEGSTCVPGQISDEEG